MIDLGIARRQSPIAVVFLAIRTLRNIGLTQLVIIVVFVVSGPFDGPLMVIPAVLVLLLGIVSVVGWWRYTFELADGELIVRKGVFRLERLTVPVDRVQSVAVEQELLHRATGLVKVQVDTAGSADAEFVIDAIPRPVAEELERALTTVPRATPAETDAGEGEDGGGVERVILHHDPSRLLTAAATASPLAGLVVVGPLVALLGQFGDDLPFDPFDVDADRVTWVWASVAVLVALAFSVVLNIARTFLQDWDLRLRAGATNLRRTSGLLSRTSAATSVPRVQVLTTNQNPLQRAAGLRDVELSTVGEGELSMVGCDDAQVDDVRELLGLVDERSLPLDGRVHPVAVWLATRNGAAVAVVVGLLGFLVLDVWLGFVAVAAVPWIWWTRRRHVRNFRWALAADLATSERVLSSSTAQAPTRKANSVKVSQTWFERRRDLASVRMATASGSVRVGMLPVAEARAILDVVLHAAETDRRPWM
ncbi:MAG: PH domain-containing protein [Actinomycetota bacterium]